MIFDFENRGGTFKMMSLSFFSLRTILKSSCSKFSKMYCPEKQRGLWFENLKQPVGRNCKRICDISHVEFVALLLFVLRCLYWFEYYLPFIG